MIGILFGAAAVLGVMAWKRHRYRHYAMAGCGPGWQDHAGFGRGWHGPGRWGHHGHHGHHGGPGRWARRAVEYRLLSELDCTPAQEKLVREELRALIDHLRGLREERAATREDLARAIAGDQLDRGVLMAMFARHDQRLVELRANITASLERVHGTLDAEQRERLAAFVRGGLGGGRPGPDGHGPYR